MVKRVRRKNVVVFKSNTHKQMHINRCWVIDYIVFYGLLLILIVIDTVRINTVYLSSFAVCALLVFLHVVLRVSCCLCAYQCCLHTWRRRREERHQRREEQSQRVKDVIQRAKIAYLESMTDD